MPAWLIISLEGGELLKGEYNEEEQHRKFLEALEDWRR